MQKKSLKSFKNYYPFHCIEVTLVQISFYTHIQMEAWVYELVEIIFNEIIV